MSDPARLCQCGAPLSWWGQCGACGRDATRCPNCGAAPVAWAEAGRVPGWRRCASCSWEGDVAEALPAGEEEEAPPACPYDLVEMRDADGNRCYQLARPGWAPDGPLFYDRGAAVEEGARLGALDAGLRREERDDDDDDDA